MNILFLRINILFIYIVIISNKLVLFRVINKYELNINILLKVYFYNNYYKYYIIIYLFL